MTPLTGAGAVLVLTAMALMLLVPLRWAPLPLLLGTFYMPLGQGVEIGPFNVFAIRMLIATGLVRLVLRQEGPVGGWTGQDRLLGCWALWAVACVVFREQPVDALKTNLGIVFNAGGCYLLLRAFCRAPDDVVRLCAITVVLLIPVAMEMSLEQATGRNAFAVLGGVTELPQMREGRLRAQGPFAHAILAGTVGAICLPLAIALWRTHRRTAIAGIVACACMVVMSASSGPVLSALFALGALLLWPLREHMRLIRWGALAAVSCVALSMNAPVYYLLARVDLAGGSTGWYRARLIETAIEHVNEWWLAGTDRTGHWMQTGLDATHADITNHYIYMGTVGGMVLMGLFMLSFASGFGSVGRCVLRQQAPEPKPAAAVSTEPPAAGRFVAWALGASLFAHVATLVSVSYFDQSFVFLYLVLAAITAAQAEGSVLPRAADIEREPVRHAPPSLRSRRRLEGGA